MRLWTLHWGHTFPYYEEILGYAREHRIKVLALNTDDALKKAVRERPVEEIESDLADRLPEMDLNDPYHRAATEAIFEAHQMGPRDTEAFYRVQVLWDEAMAQTAAEYLESPEGRGKAACCSRRRPSRSLWLRDPQEAVPKGPPPLRHCPAFCRGDPGEQAGPDDGRGGAGSSDAPGGFPLGGRIHGSGGCAKKTLGPECAGLPACLLR